MSFEQSLALGKFIIFQRRIFLEYDDRLKPHWRLSWMTDFCWGGILHLLLIWAKSFLLLFQFYWSARAPNRFTTGPAFLRGLDAGPILHTQSCTSKHLDSQACHLSNSWQCTRRKLMGFNLIWIYCTGFEVIFGKGVQFPNKEFLLYVTTLDCKTFEEFVTILNLCFSDSTGASSTSPPFAFQSGQTPHINVTRLSSKVTNLSTPSYLSVKQLCMVWGVPKRWGRGESETMARVREMEGLAVFSFVVMVVGISATDQCNSDKYRQMQVLPHHYSTLSYHSPLQWWFLICSFFTFDNVWKSHFEI